MVVSVFNYVAITVDAVIGVGVSISVSDGRLVLQIVVSS